jgi:hypothetical protein
MAVDSGKRLWVIPLYSVKYTYIVPALRLRTGRNVDVETTEGQIVCVLLQHLPRECCGNKDATGTGTYKYLIGIAVRSIEGKY